MNFVDSWGEVNLLICYSNVIFVNFVDSGGKLICYSKVIFVNFVDSWGEVNLLFQGYFPPHSVAHTDQRPLIDPRGGFIGRVWGGAGDCWL